MSEEQELINQLNWFFDFDHNIFLFHSSADTERFINTTERHNNRPRSVYVFQNTKEQITGLENLMEITSKNTFVIVVPESGKLEINVNLLQCVKNIQRRQISMKIGIFFTHIIRSSEDIAGLFRWSWKKMIINIFVSTHSQLDNINGLNTFTFNPFGNFRVVNITGTGSYDKFFLSQYSNFHQYPFVTSNDDQILDKEFNRNLLRTVIGTMNASFLLNGTESISNLSNVMFIQHYRVAMKNPQFNIVHNYVTMTNAVIVPQALPLVGLSAYVQKLTTYSLMNYTLLTIILTSVILTLIRFKMQQGKFRFLSNVVEVLNLLMNDNCNIKYQRLHCTETMIIVPLTFVGLICVNTILSAFKSYLAYPVMNRQIETIKDLYDSPLITYTLSEQWKEIATNILTLRFKDGNWTNKIRSMNSTSLFTKHINSLDTTGCYLYNLFFAKILIRVQERLNLYGHHISQIQLNGRTDTYPTSEDLPFVERINEIIDRIFQSGLHSPWERNLSRNNEHFLLERMRNMSINSESTGDVFEVSTVILYGWIASSVLFIIEMIWDKLQFYIFKMFSSGDELRVI